MTIDTIMNPRVPSDADVKAALRVTLAVAETIRECGEAPSGTIYAALLGSVTLEGLNRILRTLQNADLITVKNHTCLWIGPKLEGK